MEGDVLRRMARGAGDRHGGEHALGIARRPLQHLHAAHRAADHAEQVGRCRGDRAAAPGRAPCRRSVTTGKRRFHGWPVAGSIVERPGRAHAAAQHVGADDEVARRIEHLARPDQAAPTSLPCRSPDAARRRTGRRSAHGRSGRRSTCRRSACRRSGRRRDRGRARRRSRAAAAARRPGPRGGIGRAPCVRLRSAVLEHSCVHSLCCAAAPTKKPPTGKVGGFFERSDLLARINVVASRSAQIPRRGFYTERRRTCASVLQVCLPLREAGRT